jgi:hypothetical protein
MYRYSKVIADLRLMIVVAVLVILSVTIVVTIYGTGQGPTAGPDEASTNDTSSVRDANPAPSSTDLYTQNVSERGTENYGPAPYSVNHSSGTGRWFAEKKVLLPTNTNSDGLSGYDYNEGETGDGIYVSDYDNDGWGDVLGLVLHKPFLYQNVNGSFEEPRKLPVDGNFSSALFFDYDNDDWDDLYLLSDKRSVFFENKKGEFEKKEVGLGIDYASVRGASAADYTGNGCLDVFVVQANSWLDTRPAGYNNKNVSVEEDNGNKNRLFAGDCKGFSEATDGAGITGKAWSLATSFVDFTNNGYPDIHVANDFNNDVLYINNGNGTFDRRILPDFTNRNGMSSEVADVNGDGYLDIFVSNIHHEHYAGFGGSDAIKDRYGGRAKGNNLLINQGDGTFTDLASVYGVKKGGWGWAAEVTDFDNDMERELYHATISDAAFFNRTRDRFRRVNDTKRLLGRLGEYTTFGSVTLDYDRDGAADIAEAVLHKVQGNGFRVFENRYRNNSWLQVDVGNSGEEGTTMGTRVEVTAGNETQLRVKNSRSDYLSQSSRVLQFGLGGLTSANMTVTFPDGETRSYENITLNRRLSVSPSDD